MDHDFVGPSLWTVLGLGHCPVRALASQEDPFFQEPHAGLARPKCRCGPQLQTLMNVMFSAPTPYCTQEGY